VLEESGLAYTEESCDTINLRSSAIIGCGGGVAVAEPDGAGVIVAETVGDAAGDKAAAAAALFAFDVIAGTGAAGDAASDAPTAGADCAVPIRSHSVLPLSVAATVPRIEPVKTRELLPTNE